MSNIEYFEKCFDSKEELSELLNINEKALEFCRYQYSIDFEKPFAVYKGNGKITREIIDEILPATDTDNFKFCFFIYEPQYYFSHKYLYVVDVNDNFKFNLTAFTKPQDWYNDFYKMNVDYFTSQSAFEKVRKSDDITWFIVVQHKKYLIPQNQENNLASW